MSKIGRQLNSADLVLIRPHVTERATALSQSNTHPVYTFRVPPSATKPEVARAVKKIFKVAPVGVNVLNVPGKKILVRGRPGVKTGFKKALVFLRAGDKIDFV